MTKVVVTGAAGFIGGQTLLKLVDAGYDVLAIDRVMPPGYLITAPCSWHTGDETACDIEIMYPQPNIMFVK